MKNLKQINEKLCRVNISNKFAADLVVGARINFTRARKLAISFENRLHERAIRSHRNCIMGVRLPHSFKNICYSYNNNSYTMREQI